MLRYKKICYKQEKKVVKEYTYRATTTSIDVNIHLAHQLNLDLVTRLSAQ